MKKILIPINFNFNGYEAINYAIKFFEDEECHFYFFNTFTYDVQGLNAIQLLQEDENWFEKPKNYSENKMRAVTNKYLYNNRAKKHLFSALTDCTNLIEGIKKAIKENEIDIVVFPGKKDTNNSSEKYSRNTIRIIENIRECPVIILPPTAKFHKKPEFILVSKFENELSTSELQSWCHLVKITKGTIKIVTLSKKDEMTTLQKYNQNLAFLEVANFSNNKIKLENIESINELKERSNIACSYIICLIDKKPNIWRICGLSTSWITNFGPLQHAPLIALHS